jgi:hypothetical protein
VSQPSATSASPASAGGLSGYFAFQPAVQAQQWRKPPRVSSNHDLNHRTNHGCRALEAFIAVANSLTRSLLRDQCVLPDGCVTVHASARATPRIGRHALPNESRQSENGYICKDDRHDLRSVQPSPTNAAFASRLREPPTQIGGAGAPAMAAPKAAIWCNRAVIFQGDAGARRPGFPCRRVRTRE